ncbi:branched-chain amino acid transport system permease protein [Deinobacterium chartae]|uniref:Branched-chain amino acid transport system permease protein n=1 Tax=Deinobacterium chartae TaxID=521158 RepID=A0A841I1A2_9DEIO|nr:branched-chain amino acid ABC transporter permease [Deinobacterium chartae]MBB6098856.1 branched-chain amino acid transport system permease protein [Deinobacterium chartae]
MSAATNVPAPKRRTWWPWVLGGLLAVLAVLFPLLPFGPRAEFATQTAIFTLIIATLALSWDLLARTGQLSLAHAAFYGIGAYTFALLAKYGPAWMTWPVEMLLAALVAALFSLLLGMATLRLSGMYFAIATLAFSEVVKTVIQNLPESIAGGANGMLVEPLLGGQTRAQYYLALGVLLLAVLTSLWVRASRLHYAFTAIRQGEEVARVLGVASTPYKLLAFFLSSFLAGLAGVLYAGKTFFIIPTDTFSLSVSVTALTTAIFGGLYTTLGPVIAAAVLTVIEELLKLRIPNGYLVVYGLILILTILFLPRGLMGLGRKK